MGREGSIEMWGLISTRWQILYLLGRSLLLIFSILGLDFGCTGLVELRGLLEVSPRIGASSVLSELLRGLHILMIGVINPFNV